MADSTEIKNLLLQINANTELLRSNLSEAEKAVKKFHEDTQNHLDQVDKRWAGLGKSIEQLHKPLERLKSLSELAVGALLGESLLQKGKEALEFAGNIQFMANQIGVSTGFLQKFNYAAGQFGVSNEVAGTALTRFTRTIGNAANGNKQAIDLFDRLGVKIRDQNGNVRSAEAIYQDFANGLKKVDSPAARVADTMQAMGRQAASLTPLVARGADGFNDLARAAEQLGIVLSPELIEHSEEVNHKLAALKQIVDAQMASVIAENATAIEGLANAMVKAAGAVAQFLNKHPREALTILGALAGSRFGPTGIAVGAGAGIVGGELVEQYVDANSTDMEFRRQKLAAARARLKGDLATTNGSGFLDSIFYVHHKGDPTQTDIPGARAEYDRQLALYRAAKQAPHEAGSLGSGGAGATNNNGDDLKKAQGELADFEKAKVGATGASLSAINEEIAQKKRLIAFLKQGLTEQEAQSLASKEGTQLTKAETAARRAAKKAEEDRRKALEDDATYHQEELRLQKSILEGSRKTAANDDLRDKLQKQIINEEADTLAAQIKDRAARGGYALDPKVNQARAAHLLQLNDQNRQQGVQNVDLARGSQLLEDQLRALTLSLEGQQTILSLDEQFATTRKQRLAIELQLLALTEQAAKAEQQRILDDKSGKYNDADRTSARTRIGQIDQQHPANVSAILDRNASPLAAYKRQLHQDTDDMNDALQSVAVHGLDSLTTGLAEVVSGTKSLKAAFADMAAGIVADLAKIAIERAIVNVVGSSFFGLKDGGQVPGFAGGGLTGLLSGPGGPRSDSMLIRASTGEFITNAASTRRYLPLLKAINDNRMPAFADGGSIGSVRAPSISSAMLRGRAANERGININVDARGATNPEHVRQIARAAVLEAAPALLAASQGQTMSYLRTPKLPGAIG